ncbi:Zn(II)2Cys6 transcription factor domain-containing protein [Aspergillus undulatus]|uniref:Zn(II)2Cys6 transcription factor domain-containing protein n=1 Tax=Aspergillus undulatus TaxID=1810928 RepID=UPI003CCD5307
MDGDVQSGNVLRCGLCNKPFNKPCTLQRHGYYCRSRRAGPPAISRSRSCIACAKRKTRCDNRRPRCSRCLGKGVECRYPNPLSASRQRSRPYSNTPSLLTGTETSSDADVGSAQEIGGHGHSHGGSDAVLDNALTLPAPASNPLDVEVSGFAIEGDDYIDWSNPVPEVNLTDFDFLNPIPQSGYKTAHVPNHPFSPEIPTSTPMPLAPTLLPRLLVHRPNTTPGGQRTSTLIMHTLKSYLMMLVRDNTPPPFIHLSLVPIPANRNSGVYNPLLTCLKFIQSLKNTLQDKSRRIFWDNVRGECERLISLEHQHGSQELDRWGLLGAMQALSVYILIRLDEGETEENNVDFLLLGAVTVVARQLSAGDISEDRNHVLYNGNSGVSRKEWIFEESRRRLSVIYRIIKMLVYFEPAAKCDLPTDLILAPLPAKKPLWEAADGAVWKAETERNPDMYRTAFGLATTGELVRLDKGLIDGQVYQSDAVLSHMALDARTVSRSAANWEEWCSGMDGFGGLVMLAASLVA